MDVDIVTLEDNKEYGVLKEIECDNQRYVILFEPDSPKNFLVRKIIVENNEEFLTKLSSEDEYDSVLSKFLKENN